jgi:uncharacterized protein YecT (DUF1311 family)
MILIAVLGLAAAVQEEPNCKDPQSQSEMNACTYIDYEKAETAPCHHEGSRQRLRSQW